MPHSEKSKKSGQNAEYAPFHAVKKTVNAAAVVIGRGASFMFDIFKVFNDNKAVLAEIPRFVNAWIEFMNKLHDRLARFEAALERHDSKLQTVIEIVSDGHPATVTPELHAAVADWATDDPRNGTKMEPS